MGTVGETVGRLLVTSMLYDTSKRLVYAPPPPAVPNMSSIHIVQSVVNSGSDTRKGVGDIPHIILFGALVI